MAQKEINDKIFDQLSRIEERLATMPSPGEPDFQSLGIWLPEAFHEPGIIGGIVVDEGVARESECRRIPLGEHGHLTYSKGVVGALNEQQEKLYCENISDMQLPPELIRREAILKDVAVACQSQVQHLEQGSPERLETFMQCFVDEAKRRGVEI